jgi:hypothetical protein
MFRVSLFPRSAIAACFLSGALGAYADEPQAEPVPIEQVMAVSGDEVLEFARTWSDSVHPVLRLNLGGTPFPLIGSEEDLHRNLVIGLGGGILFCEGTCGLFLDVLAAHGTRDEIVATEWTEWETRVSFYLYPIAVDDTFFAGAGIDLAISAGDLDHRWEDTRTDSDILSLQTGLNLNLRFDLFRRADYRVGIAVNGRLYLRTILRQCDAGGPCVNRSGAATLEAAPFNGGGVETTLWIYTEFGR